MPSEMEEYLLTQKLNVVSHTPTDGELYSEFEEYLNSHTKNKNIPDDAYLAFQQGVSNIEDYHYWLEENFTSNRINSIEAKFVHGLIIAQKKS